MTLNRVKIDPLFSDSLEFEGITLVRPHHLPMVTLVTPLLPRFNRNPLPRLMLLRILNPMVLFLLYAATLSCSQFLYARIIQGMTLSSRAMAHSSPSKIISAD